MGKMMDDIRPPTEDIPASNASENGRLRHVWLKDATVLAAEGYWIKGVIGRGQFIVVYGSWGVGKTFFVVALVAHIAAGRPWRGRRVKQGLVVYIAAEAGMSIMQRAVALRDAYGLTGADIPLAMVPGAIDLLNRKDVDSLVERLRQIAAEAKRPLALVVIDTLSRAIPGGDENGSKDITRVVGFADEIRQKFGAATLLVHHAGKDAARGARGHSSLVAAADTVVQIEDGAATIEKSRDGQSGLAFAFTLDVVQVAEDEDGDPITTCVVRHLDDAPAETKLKLKDNERRGFDVLVKHQKLFIRPGRLSVSDWRSAFLKQLPSHQTKEAKQKAWERTYKGLVEKRAVEVDDDGESVWLGWEGVKPMDLADVLMRHDRKPD